MTFEEFATRVDDAVIALERGAAALERIADATEEQIENEETAA